MEDEMRDLIRRQMIKVEEISYTEYCSPCHGTIGITGAVFRRPQGYDLLGHIWSSARKKVKRNLGIDATAIFSYNEAESYILCSFYPNFSIIEGTDITEEEYKKKFTNAFPKLASFFELVLKNFLTKHYGYELYIEYIELIPGISSDDLDESINIFLREEGIKKRREKKRKKQLWVLKPRQNTLIGLTPKIPALAGIFLFP